MGCGRFVTKPDCNMNGFNLEGTCTVSAVSRYGILFDQGGYSCDCPDWAIGLGLHVPPGGGESSYHCFCRRCK